MSSEILVVNQEPNFASQLSSALAETRIALNIMAVIDRKQAMTKLQHCQFNKIITALKIPRISDGYLFLGHLLKSFRNNDIIVLADPTKEEISRSITTLGVDCIYKPEDIQGIVSALHTNDVNENIADPANHTQQRITDTSNLYAEKIQAALQLVMGPVSNMIYEEALMLQQNPNDMRELLKIVTTEIADEDKIVSFLQKLKEL